MSLLISSFGSRGDVQPMVALCRHLLRRGHAVRFVGPPDSKAFVNAHAPGVEHIVCGSDFQALMGSTADLQRESPLKLGHVLSAHFVEQAIAQWRAFSDLIDDRTVFIGSGLQFSAAHVVEARRARYAFVALQPQFFRSRAWPPMIVRSQRLPGFVNAMAWSAYEQLWKNILRKTLDALRSELGLRSCADPMSLTRGSQHWLAADPLLVADAGRADVGEIVGALFLDDERALSPDVDAFLSEPAVYFGFGSLGDNEAARTAELVLAAARAANVRLVVSKGWAGYSVAPSSDVLLVGDEPHAKLFSRVSGVVHHGGAGTTHAALRAGVPQLIVAHTLDQFYFGAQVHARGLGANPLRREELSVERLAERLRSLPSFAAKARDAAAQTKLDAAESLTARVAEA